MDSSEHDSIIDGRFTHELNLTLSIVRTSSLSDDSLSLSFYELILESDDSS